VVRRYHCCLSLCFAGAEAVVVYPLVLGVLREWLCCFSQSGRRQFSSFLVSESAVLLMCSVSVCYAGCAYTSFFFFSFPCLGGHVHTRISAIHVLLDASVIHTDTLLVLGLMELPNCGEANLKEKKGRTDMQ
jgi:hypothetical protein